MGQTEFGIKSFVVVIPHSAFRTPNFVHPHLSCSGDWFSQVSHKRQGAGPAILRPLDGHFHRLQPRRIHHPFKSRRADARRDVKPIRLGRRLPLREILPRGELQRLEGPLGRKGRAASQLGPS